MNPAQSREKKDGTHADQIRDTQVRAAQVRQLYSQSLWGLIGAFVSAPLLVAALWSVVSQARLVTWLVCCLLVQIYRYHLVAAFHRASPSDDDTDSWGRWFALVTIASGLLWGITAVFLFPEHSMAHQFLLALFLAGISAAAAVVYSATVACFLPIILVELLPISFRYLHQGDDFTLCIGAAILVFAAVLSLTGRELHRANAASLRLGFERMELADSLEQARDELELKVEQRTADLARLNRQLKEEISTRHRTEQELRASEELYRTILDNVEYPIFLKDSDLTYAHCNPAMARLFGVPCSDLVGKTDEILFGKELADRMRVRDKRVLQGEIVESEDTKSIQGASKTFHVVKAPVRDSAGSITGICGIARDITDRKRAEQEKESLRLQLLQAQKMEALGTLTGGIAHEFNNLLTIASGYTELLLTTRAEEDPDREDFQKVLSACHRGAELVRKLRVFAGKGEYDFRILDLNGEVEQTVGLLSKMIAPTIEIEVKPADDLQTIRADSAQVSQLLMNLALNARDAMPDGGRLTIETGNATFDEDTCKKYPAATPGKYVQLTVSDTGEGMDEQTREHIFEPFFTTHGLARRSGLGLAVVHGIVEEHGGFMTCDSTVGSGTVFRVYLPAVTVEHGVVGKALDRKIAMGE